MRDLALVVVGGLAALSIRAVLSLLWRRFRQPSAAWSPPAVGRVGRVVRVVRGRLRRRWKRPAPAPDQASPEETWQQPPAAPTPPLAMRSPHLAHVQARDSSWWTREWTDAAETPTTTSPPVEGPTLAPSSADPRPLVASIGSPLPALGERAGAHLSPEPAPLGARPAATGLPRISAPSPRPAAEDAVRIDERVLIGRSDAHDLRTAADVDLVLSPRGSGWVLQSFDLGGSSAHLGPVPLGLAALPVTEGAAELTIASGLRTERIDLGTHAAAPARLHGTCRLVDGPEISDGELWAVESGGVVTVVLLHGDLPADDVARRRAETIVRAYPAIWMGDAEAYLSGLRLDLHDCLGLWPAAPSGTAVEVAVAGPGPDGPVNGATLGRWTEHPARLTYGSTDHPIVVELAR